MAGIRNSILTLLVLVVLAAMPASGQATGVVDLSWGECSPIVSQVTDPVAGPHRLTVSVLGHEASSQSYEVFLAVEEIPQFLDPFPDAWRFDDPGCQGPSRIDIQHVPLGALSKVCPSIHGAAVSIAITDYTFDALSSRARITVANTYPAGVPASNPTVRYFLAAVVFDHTFSVVGASIPGPPDELGWCGGFERDIRIRITRTDWVDLQWNQHDFIVGQGTATFCGSCGVVPAARTTWGTIKSQYRR